MELATIMAATDNFSDSNKLGQGGFGIVYKVTVSSLFNVINQVVLNIVLNDSIWDTYRYHWQYLMLADISINIKSPKYRSTLR